MSSHYPPYAHPYPYQAPMQYDPRQAGQGVYQGAFAAPYQPGFDQMGPMPGAAGQGQAQQGLPYQGYHQRQYAYPARASAPFFNFSNDRFLKGLLIGAAATYLVTNESVQRTLIKGAVRTWSMLQGGVEEIKERFHDAEAELHHDAERRATRQDD